MWPSYSIREATAPGPCNLPGTIDFLRFHAKGELRLLLLFREEPVRGHRDVIGRAVNFAAANCLSDHIAFSLHLLAKPNPPNKVRELHDQYKTADDTDRTSCPDCKVDEPIPEADHGAMPRKPAPKPDDPEQSKRFIAMAREIGVDESEGAFERALMSVARAKPSSPKPSGRRSRRTAKPASS